MDDYKTYDFTIVGAGLFGCVCAYELNKLGYKVQVVEKRGHIGGNCYTYNLAGINVHKYGPHIFHTSNEKIWNYINQFAKFNNFINCPIAKYKNEVYNLPFNMNTFTKIWPDIFTPDEAKCKIEEEKRKANITSITNLEEQAISLVGTSIYEKLIKGYTEKQWGKSCTELPPSIIKRLPLRFTYNNNYFNDCYQGIPIGGYTQIFDKMLKGIKVLLNYDFFVYKDEIERSSKCIIYTGQLDRLFRYKYGKLEYRTVIFDTKVMDAENLQGNAVINFTAKSVPFTRIIEHKHFENTQSSKTVISIEKPVKWKDGFEPYYTINDEKNENLYAKYVEEINKLDNYYIGGRLAQYKYFDMDDTIEEALKLVSKIGVKHE